MKKKITVSQLAEEIKERLEKSKSIDCCKDELINLANLASNKIGHEMIEVTWKD
jgi:hypothetical protein